MGVPLRLLLVEDSENDAMLLVRELTRAGFELVVERVETAHAMQAALDRQPWDIVLGDYSMPQFGGAAALALLRERGLDVPFIIVSGTIGEERAVAAMKAGASDYVPKDKLKRLVPVIERELREAAGRRERLRAEAALREAEAGYGTRGHLSVQPCRQVPVREPRPGSHPGLRLSGGPPRARPDAGRVRRPRRATASAGPR